jgi:hypothetical protein
MAFYTIRTSNTSFLSNAESVVYAGKNGFTTGVGIIPMLCNTVSSNSEFIQLTIVGLNTLVDDNFNLNVLEVPSVVGVSNTFIKAPINQYAQSVYEEGSSGYFSRQSNISLEVSSYNIASNTITVFNKSIEGGIVSSLLQSAPFYISLNQTVLANNFNANSLFVTGSYKNISHTANVQGMSSYEFTLKQEPRSRNDLRVYVDDIRTENFSWSSSDPTKVTLPSLVDSSQAVVILDKYSVPSIEANDLVSLSTFNNSYTVVSTSYQPASASYDEPLTLARAYKITLDRPISSDVLSYYIINTSQDLEGTVGNITSNSFTIDYEDSYPYTYSLANNGIYYLYQKNKVRYTTAKLDEYGSITGLSPQNYIVEATTINRYNRISSTVRGLLQIDSIKLSKVSSITITERIFIDTTGGASISATIEFPPILGRDVTSYELLYRVVSVSDSTVPEYTRVILNQDTTVDSIRHTVNNLNRGSVAGSNSLDVIVTPLNGDSKGFSTTKVQPLLGKLTNPSGLSDFNVTQQGDSVIYTWQFAQTEDGFILDIDTKEVEIREYPGVVNLADQESINATWSIALVVDRIPFPNTTYTTPIAKYGSYTYLIRVRDTSNNESDKINASVIELGRTVSRIYKAYNEGSPDTSFAVQDGQSFPNSNTYPELDFPSFSDSLYNGFVYADSTNVDNANGSSIGFSVAEDNPSYLSSTDQPYAEYTTQIRDMGRVIKGAIRIKPIISITSSATYNDQYRLIQSGITDPHDTANLEVNTSVLVDNAFGGIGYLLGYNNSNAATVSYNTYAKTLTSGGPSGNVFAIRNPGQFANDFANSNMFAYIAGVISENAIQLGEVFYSNGRSTGGNAFSNITISGNSYELVDLAQFLDTAGTLTYLGPTRDIVQNVYIRYATDNVFYTAAANGVPGFPGHGNTNPNAFVGATDNAALGFKRYVSGDIDFRYVQVKLQYSNKEPSTSSLILESLTYEIDVQEKTFTSVAQVNSVNGAYIDYSFKDFIESPKVTASIYNGGGAYAVNISNVSTLGCNVTVYQSNTGTAVSGFNVSVAAIGI